MRLTVDHRTHYRFGRPRSRLVQLLRLSPDDNDDQAIANWDVHVDCDARLRAGRDGFGNRTIMLYIEGPSSSIELSVSGEVLTNPAGGMVRGSVEPLPPALFLRATELTPAEPLIAAFALGAVGGSDDVSARLGLLNAALHRRCGWQANAALRGVSQAFGHESAAAADLAQMFIVAARSLGVPARYVSGYRAVDGDVAVPHAWAEAHVAGAGWMTFDPATGGAADESYIRAAVALDAAGAAPLAGAGLGAPVMAGDDAGAGAAQD
ncbi:transglutaminase family protein [Sphingomonas sp. RT2P30]|uniref:transglutaminase family protein n=1 Tax=Parasphingomonas halimpatiens TaxID=3096162 RepID=UPI002FC91D38